MFYPLRCHYLESNLTSRQENGQAFISIKTNALSKLIQKNVSSLTDFNKIIGIYLLCDEN